MAQQKNSNNEKNAAKSANESIEQQSIEAARAEWVAEHEEKLRSLEKKHKNELEAMRQEHQNAIQALRNQVSVAQNQADRLQDELKVCEEDAR